MTRDQILAELRSVIDDTVRPYAWSDTRLAQWLSEGQDRFCKDTGFWSDRSTYTITTVLNQPNYTISSRIIAVRSIWDGVNRLLDLSAAPNTHVDNKDLFGESYSGDSYASGEYPAGTLPTRPYRYRTDLETGVISFLEPPIADVVLKLRVHRKSKVAFSTDSTEAELPDEFQFAMVEYAAAKAFGDHDRELQDPVKAQDHMLNFKAYVKDGAKAYRRLTGEYTDVIPNPLYVV